VADWGGGMSASCKPWVQFFVTSPSTGLYIFLTFTQTSRGLEKNFSILTTPSISTGPSGLLLGKTLSKLFTL